MNMILNTTEPSIMLENIAFTTWLISFWCRLKTREGMQGKNTTLDLDVPQAIANSACSFHGHSRNMFFPSGNLIITPWQGYNLFITWNGESFSSSESMMNGSNLVPHLDGDDLY